MVRKQPTSYGESSDDDFHMSDEETSPLMSRLKRSRRSSAREHRSHVLSPQESSFQPEPEDGSHHENDRVDDVICIPDSLEGSDKDVPGSVENSVSDVPNDPINDNTNNTAATAETENPSERFAECDDINIPSACNSEKSLTNGMYSLSYVTCF